MLKQRATQEIKVVARDRTYTSAELLRLLAKNPKEASSVAAGVTAISADPAIIRGVGSTALGGYLGDEGEVETSALTGLEEALIVIALVALAGGFGVGYMKGKEDGLEEGAANDEAETEGSGEEGETPSGGDGGDGEGGEEGEGDGGGTEE